MPQTVLQIAPATPQLIDAYVKAAQERGYIPLQGSPDGYIFVVDGAGDFLAGVTVLPTNGRYILYEDAITKPGIPMRVAHSLAEFIVDTIVMHCNMCGKIPVCPVTSPGIRSIMAKRGFFEVPSYVMRRWPHPYPVDVVEEHKAASERVVGRSSDSSEAGAVMALPQATQTVARQKRKAKRRVR